MCKDWLFDAIIYLYRTTCHSYVGRKNPALCLQDRRSMSLVRRSDFQCRLAAVLLYNMTMQVMNHIRRRALGVIVMHKRRNYVSAMSYRVVVHLPIAQFNTRIVP